MTWYEVIVNLRGVKEPITSAQINRKEDAEEQLSKIREAQRNGEWIELEWLSAHGPDVISAHVQERSIGIA